MKPSEQQEHIEQTFNLYRDPSGVLEARALNIPDGKYKLTMSGYFEASASGAFVDAIRDCAKAKPGGIYACINPANLALLARCANRVKVRPEQATADADIVRRCWLPVDMDVTRPAGISASDAEHDAAIERATGCRDWLRDTHGAACVLADSGNGAHLLLPCDLPNDADALRLVTGVLKGLASRFDDDAIHVDQTVFNAARILKVYGTLVCKGDNMPERPHRYARLLDVPSDLAPVSLETLEAIAALAAPVQPAPAAPASTSKSASTGYTGKTLERLDVPAFLAKHGIAVHHEEEGANGWHQWALHACPFNPDHTNPDSMVSQQAGTGKVSFHCRHNSCKGNKWQQFRVLFEPDYKPFDPPRPPTNTPPAAADSESGSGTYRNLTDIGNAERLIDAYGRDMRYCPPNKEWWDWNGKVWEKDQIGQVDRYAKATVRRIYSEASTCEDANERKSIIKHALRSEGNERIRAMIARAEVEEGVPILPKEMDADPWLLSCNNGTVDLRTGELRPHSRDDLITKITPIDYDPDAACPLWRTFLARVVPDEDTRGYMMRAIGYSLTGSVNAQCLFFLWGAGQNGKSTVIYILEQIMGAYLKKTPAEVLMRSMTDGTAANPDVADLHGKRICAVSEIQQGRKLNEALIKDLTGGDSITARRLHCDPFTFEPTHKIWMAGNYKPVITGGDDGIWRRVKLIPFNVRIPEAEKDEHLRDKLKMELPGILRDCVRACLHWQQKGLGEPEAVKEATQEYKSEMDVIGAFLEEKCVTGRGQDIFCKASELHTNYEIWCAGVGEKPLDARTFGQAIKQRFAHKRSGKGITYLGVRVLTGSEEAKRDSEE